MLLSILMGGFLPRLTALEQTIMQMFAAVPDYTWLKYEKKIKPLYLFASNHNHLKKSNCYGFLSTKRNHAILIWIPLLKKKKSTFMGEIPSVCFETDRLYWFCLSNILTAEKKNPLEAGRHDTQGIKWQLHKCLPPINQTESCSHRYFMKLSH